MHLTYSGLDQRALHARGRQERATVTDVYWVDQGADPPTHVAQPADPSGRPIPGEVSCDGLKVGRTITVTVDPRRKIPVLLGTPSTGSGKFRAAGITAGVEILFLSLAAYQGAADRPATEPTDKPKRTQKPKEFRHDAPAASAPTLLASSNRCREPLSVTIDPCQRRLHVRDERATQWTLRGVRGRGCSSSDEGRMPAGRDANHDPPEGQGPSLGDDPPRWDPHGFGSPSPRPLGGSLRGARP